MALPEPCASLPGEGTKAGLAAKGAPGTGPREELPNPDRGQHCLAPPLSLQGTAQQSYFEEEKEKIWTYLENPPVGWGTCWAHRPLGSSLLNQCSLSKKASRWLKDSGLCRTEPLHQPLRLQAIFVVQTP